jgi:hypothetical protein
MAAPLLLLLGAGGLIAAYAASSQKKAEARKRDQGATERYIATCPLDPNLTPEQAQAVRVAMSAAYLGQRTPAELAADAQMMAASGHPMAAACLAGLASSLAYGANTAYPGKY